MKKKNLFALLIIAAAIGLVAIGFNQGWLPLKIGQAPAVERAGDNFSVSLEAAGKTYQAKVAAGATAYDLMKKLQLEQGLKFSAKEYAGLGALIEEINGAKNDVKANKFWIFYVNGKSSEVGVSNYVLKNNDIIGWKYEGYKF